MTPIAISGDQVRRYRLLRSGLLEPLPSPEAVASRLFGVQAQIHPAAGLALWNRTPGLTHSNYEALLYEQRSLVKLWGQRNTLHLYASHEWPMIHGAMSTNKTWWGKIAEKEDRHAAYDELIEAVALTLRERGIMSRADLLAAGFDVDDDHLSPWGGLFADLVRRGHACHAGRAANEGLFAHRNFWLPDLDWDTPPADAANRVSLRRYLHVFGPATLQEFMLWRGTRGEPPRRWWQAEAANMAEVSVEGKPAFILHSDLDELLKPAAQTCYPMTMLYRFDPLLLGNKDKRWIVPAAHYKQVWRPAGHIEGVVLVKGKAVATWRYTRKATGLSITVDPFRRISKTARRQIERKSTQIAGFFELPLLDVDFAAETV